MHNEPAFLIHMDLGLFNCVLQQEKIFNELKLAFQSLENINILRR